MTTPTLPAAPEIVETIDPVARSCVASWDAVAGIGDMLASGRLVDAWNMVAATMGTCWGSFAALVQSAVPFLG